MLTSTEENSTPSEPTNDFFGNVTQLFFTTHYAIHVGLCPTVDHMNHFGATVSHMRREIETFRRQNPTAAIDPQVQMMEATVKKVKSLYHTMNVVADKGILGKLMSFYSLTSQWLKGICEQKYLLSPLLPE